MTELAFLDLETTGTDPERHSIWEIGLIVGDVERRWVLQLSDDQLAAAEPMALKIGDFYRRYFTVRDTERERYQDAQKFPPRIEDPERQFVPSHEFKDLAELIVRTIGSAHIVGAVPSFDARFLGDWLRRRDRVPAWHYHLVDIEALAAGKLGLQPPWNSKDLYRALGVDPTYFEAHTALGDARMAKSVYERVFDSEATWPESWDDNSVIDVS